MPGSAAEDELPKADTRLKLNTVSIPTTVVSNQRPGTPAHRPFPTVTGQLSREREHKPAEWHGSTAERAGMTRDPPCGLGKGPSAIQTRPLIGIMWVTFGHLRPSGHIMPDHAGDRGAVFLVLAPHDHLAYQADPVDLGAQSDLIGAPEPMSIEAVLAVPNGGDACVTLQGS